MWGRGEKPLVRRLHRRIAVPLRRCVVSSHRWVWCLLVLVSFFGCRGSTPLPPPGPVPPASKTFWLTRPELPAFTDDLDRESLHQALQRSLEYARRLQPGQTLSYGERQISGTILVQTLEAFQQVVATASTPAALQQAILERFHVLQSPGRDERGEVLFTGYYEIELEGSLVPSTRFPYPLYKRPPDLIDVEAKPSVPWPGVDRSGVLANQGQTNSYYTRREIDGEGKLRGRGLELFWLRNPVDGFFLHVQGSGQIRLPDGQVRRVHYAASNGHPYYSIGRVLLDEGRLPRDAMSLQGLRRYFRDHPEETTRILYRNPRYIFFRPVAQGPQGNLGLILVPGRSIAADQRLFPPGGLAFVQIQQPVLNAQGEITAWRPASRFVFNHDTGSAITGPGRIDLFWGSGAQAEMAAGHMQHTGKLFFLLKRAP
jgi:membrane-bound lytic murein transglycosylase A